MLFSVDHDSGGRVSGYLVPDSFTKVGRVRLCRGGEQIAVFELDHMIQGLVDAGRHGTGLCAFQFDENNLPGLASFDDLEIYDDDSECLIYRRKLPGMIAKRVIRFETSLLPLWSFDHGLRPEFQYFMNGVDRFGRETVEQMLLLLNTESSYISGRINFRPFAFLIERGMECCTLIQEPRDEFAERLLVLRRVRHVGTQLIGERDASRLWPAIDFAEKLPLNDERSLRRALMDMPPEVAVLLSNPLVRLFTTVNPGDMPSASAVASALDVLSTFTIVGLRDHAEDFSLGVEEWLGLAPHRLPVIPRFGAVNPLGEFMRASGVADVLLEKDMELYYHLAEARAEPEASRDASVA